MVKFLLLAVCVAITVWLSLIYIGRLIRGFEEIPNKLMLALGAAVGGCIFCIFGPL